MSIINTSIFKTAIHNKMIKTATKQIIITQNAVNQWKISTQKTPIELKIKNYSSIHQMEIYQTPSNNIIPRKICSSTTKKNPSLLTKNITFFRSLKSQNQPLQIAFLSKEESHSIGKENKTAISGKCKCSRQMKQSQRAAISTNVFN